MNDKRNPLRLPLSSFPRLSVQELEERYAQVQEARDEDWKKWRKRERELLEQIPAKVKAPKLQGMDLFTNRMGKVAPFIAPLVAIVYTWWENTAFPAPGKGFWTSDTVRPVFQSVVLAMFVMMLYNPQIMAIIVAIIGCLMFYYFFR